MRYLWTLTVFGEQQLAEGRAADQMEARLQARAALKAFIRGLRWNVKCYDLLTEKQSVGVKEASRRECDDQQHRGRRRPPGAAARRWLPVGSLGRNKLNQQQRLDRLIAGVVVERR